ncbi:MAG TPA: DUF4169 family protein [Methylovirgula sp.]|nr:DUF4169 family protein [Methylovirgula sp.]
MSGEIVNLRRARKAKQRAAEADTAAENRLRFGQSKEQRTLDAKTTALDDRRFEAHKRELIGRDPAESRTDSTDN